MGGDPEGAQMLDLTGTYHFVISIVKGMNDAREGREMVLNIWMMVCEEGKRVGVEIDSVWRFTILWDVKR